MKASFLKILSIFMILATVLSIGSIYFFQTNNSHTTIQQDAKEKFESAKLSIANNEKEIQTLKETLNHDYFSKTHIFADIIALKPDIIKDKTKLEKIRKDLDVDELHITDENGIIQWGTVDDYIGFDFHTSEQTKPFLEGITNPSFELAQEPQLNGTKNILFQYIGVARKDKPGVIQIGMTPKRLETALKNNTLENVLSKYTIGNTGYLFSFHKSDNIIASFPDKTIIGKSISDIGFSSPISQTGFAKINGIDSYYITDEYNNYLLCAVIPKTELYSARNTQLIITLISNTIIFFILTLLISKLLQKIIINGINKIVKLLQNIQNGNLDTIVDVQNQQEFRTLSNGINNMVKSLKEKITQTQELIQNSEQLLNVQNQAFSQVRNCSKDITSFSEELLTISKTLSEGCSEQSNAVAFLSQNVEQVSQQMKKNAALANNAKNIAQNAGSELSLGNNKIFQMADVMHTIYNSSSKISEIIKTIDEIAEQSNLLALNASVEAAKVGDQGKGFSIIAKEIKDLALKSIEAADNTNSLIQNTLNTITNGTKQVEDTTKMLETIISGAKEATQLMAQVAQAAEEETASFTCISDGINQITSVVETNINASQKSEDTSKQLSQKAIQLQKAIYTE